LTAELNYQRWRKLAASFLQSKFKEYYAKNDVVLPSDFAFREFAAQKWLSKSYTRHMSFRTRIEVGEYLRRNAPRHFYYSSARYDNPAAEDMESKGWRSADLTFDIDADHLAGCEEGTVHVETVEGELASFVDHRCIEEAKLHTLNLIDALTQELGLSRSQLFIEFSGHRGFHVTAYLGDNDEYAQADGDVRREIVNYLACVGLDLEALKMKLLKPSLGLRRAVVRPVPVKTVMPGIRGRIARIIARLSALDGKPHLVKLVTSPGLLIAGEWLQDYESYLERALKYTPIGIDTQVTIDVKRLIRVPLSIHGKTGLLVKPLDVRELERFSLTEDLSPFRREDPIRVELLVSAEKPVSILGHRLKLKQGTRVSLPAPLAIFLMARGLAIPAGVS
jgi:DNA primase small subunit